MVRLPLSRAVCLVLLLLLSMSPALSAAGGRHGQKAPKPAAAGVLSQAWARMVRLFGALGSEMDPDGKPTPSSPTGDLGSDMDPNGGK